MNLLPLVMIPFALGQAEPTIPDTPNGRFLTQFLATVNSGDPATIRKFAERLGNDDLLGLHAENHALLLQKLYQQSGGLKLERVRPDGGACIVKSRIGDRTIILEAGLNAAGKGEYGIMRGAENSLTRTYSWPKNPAGKGGVVKAVGAYLDALAKEDLWNGVVLIAQGDRVLLHTAHGLADRGLGVKIRKDTKINLASLGKMFTATLVGELVQEGKVSLDDPLGKFRPEWPDVAAREKVTLGMLLSHTAGLGSLFQSPNYDRARRYTDATDMTSALVGEPLGFEPGKGWSYSNGGYVMLGSIVEKVLGMPYETAVRERVFRPLGMVSSGWADGNEALPNCAALYDRDLMDPLGLEPKRRDGMFAGWRGGPHGGGYSTAEDLFRFGRALRTHRLMSEATTKRFFTVSEPAKGPRYALGFVQEDINGMLNVGHNGHARADLGVLWDLDVTVIALGNDLSEPTPRVARMIREYIVKNAATFR
ncbi:class A beta-lactamase-related serine hydrolase [bacterium]|nr:MAG: class A beta-lactamase-related serine hydrolase [bacterium]